MRSRIAWAAVLACLWSTAGSAQDPVKAFPENYRLVFENSALSVIRVHYGPHEKVGVHDHSSFPTVYIYLSDSGPVRFQHYEAKPFPVTRPPTVSGSYRVSPGLIERHTVENLGDSSSDFLRIELKQVPMGRLKDFRGAAPAGLAQSSATVEYDVPALRIERIICVGPAVCPVKSSSASSLLVPVSELSASIGSAKLEKLDAGEVRWLPPAQSATIEPGSSSPVQLLRIILPASSH